MPSESRNRKPSKFPAVLVTIGAIFSLGLVWGVIGTVIGMMRAFNTMGAEGMGKPEALAEDIGFSLHTTAIGFMITPVGIVILSIGIWLMIKQKRELAGTE